MGGREGQRARDYGEHEIDGRPLRLGGPASALRTCSAFEGGGTHAPKRCSGMWLITMRTVCRSEIDAQADDLEQLLDQVEAVSPDLLECRS